MCFRRPLATVSALVIIAGIAVWRADAQDLNEAKEDLLFLGPFSLAELAADFGKRQEKWEGPKAVEVQNSLAKCKFYYVDKRVRKDGKWFFANEEGYPKILVEGPLSFEFKDIKGRRFLVYTKGFTVAADLTDYTVAPAKRRGTVSVALAMDRERGTPGFTKETTNWRMTFRYDSQGALNGKVVER